MDHRILDWSRKATADYRTKQYYALKLAASNYATLCDTQGELSIGVLQNKPNTGEAATVCFLGISNIIAHDTNIVAGSKLTVDANGKVEVAASADEVIGIALEACGTNDDIISAFICPMGVL